MKFNQLKIWFYKLFKPSNIVITGYCSGCGSCCKNILLMIYNDTITDEATFIDIQKNNAFYKNLEITGSNSSNELTFKCNLLKENNCSVYKKRPLLCRNYPSVKMFKHGGSLHEECTYEIKAKKDFKYFLQEYMDVNK